MLRPLLSSKTKRMSNRASLAMKRALDILLTNCLKYDRLCIPRLLVVWRHMLRAKRCPTGIAQAAHVHRHFGLHAPAPVEATFATSEAINILV